MLAFYLQKLTVIESSGFSWASIQSQQSATVSMPCVCLYLFQYLNWRTWELCRGMYVHGHGCAYLYGVDILACVHGQTRRQHRVSANNTPHFFFFLVLLVCFIYVVWIKVCMCRDVCSPPIHPSVSLSVCLYMSKPKVNTRVSSPIPQHSIYWRRVSH